MNLFDQLLQLQVIDNAYTKWANYREQLTNYLIHHTSEGSSLAIMGAGRCNDLDLKRLATHFGTITLIDKDERALKEALALYDLEGSPIVTTKEVDFVGITPKEYRHYADTLMNRVRHKGMYTDVQELANSTLDYLEELYNRTLRFPLDLEEERYDYTVAFGVHSQLISMLEWIWRMVLEAINKEEETVRNTLMYMNDGAAQKFNEAVIKATRNTVFIGFEKERIGRVGTIQGAIQGIEDIERRIVRGKIQCIDKQQFEWPFDEAQSIYFNMQLYQLAKQR